MKKFQRILVGLTCFSLTAGFIFTPALQYQANSKTNTVFAEEVSDSQLIFNKSADGMEVTECSKDAVNVEIPEEVDGLPVTSIAAKAFFNCDKLESVSIPDGVLAINEGTFQGCYNLSNVKIPDSVKSIGKDAFNGCVKLYSINIPDSVEEIMEMAFENCAALDEIIIPDSVTTIGNGAFEYCTGLSSVKMSKNISLIDRYAFNDCENLINVTLPDKDITIGTNAFTGTPWLSDRSDDFVIIGKNTLIKYTGTDKNVVIPDGITFIEENAFKDCSDITSITIPDTVTNIENYAFENCKNLKQINIPGMVEDIDRGLFTGCTSLESIELPDSIRAICDNAFSRCTSLTSIKIPVDVSFIGNEAFSGCTSLEEVVFNTRHLQCIVDKAFMGCTSLKSIEIPKTVLSLCDEAFSGCTQLADITIYYNTGFFGSNVFKDCPVTIHGFSDTATQEYASQTNIPFDIIGEKPVETLTGSIHVANLPDKLVYGIGEELDLTGGIVEGSAIYQAVDMPESIWNVIPSAMDTFEIDSSEFNNKVPGKYTIYVSIDMAVKYLTTSFEVTVEDSSAKLGDVKSAVPYGDIDGNGYVDISDLSLLSLSLLKDVSLTYEQQNRADVCYDSELNVADLAQLKQFIMMDKVNLGPQE